MVALISVLIVACGAAATATPVPEAPLSQSEPPTAAPEPTPTLGFISTPTPAPQAPTATPQPTPTPGAVASARDTVVLVTNGEPDQLGAFSQGCSGNVPSLVCEDVASDPLTWIDSETFEVVPLSGVESWSQEGPDRWRFQLRDGVTFHNGEPFNAAAAKLGIDWHGDTETAGHGTGSYGFHGGVRAEVVDELTVDVVCDVACPIFPRTAMFLKFQAPNWWATADEGVRDSTTMGFGPYRMVEWRRGIEVELEAYEDYKPNIASDARAPSIQRAFQFWRDEELVRAAMVEAGEADLAFEIGFQNIDRVPQALTGTNNEVYTLVADNIWHPELKKKQVREALILAIDCETLMDTLYDGLQECYGNVSQTGTVGITPENSAGYPYDPDRAKELLAEAGYDPANEVRIHSRQGRVFRDVELWESVVSMWREVGVTASLQILEPGRAREVRRSGCGQFDEPRTCASQAEPPGPTFASSHYYETATSNESLDMQRQLLLRNSCGNVNSRVCDLVPGFEDGIQDAIQTPLGPERTRKMEELATFIHDEFWFIPMFQVVTVYGLSEDLVWTPRYDPRTRINAMTFK
ncbi:MAG: ABC transporter substrate-binding protein [Dehalococcoidia bacterium]